MWCCFIHADAVIVMNMRMRRLLAATSSRGRVLALRPNADAGSKGIVQAIAEAIERTKDITTIDHLARDEFIGLLKRPEVRALVGNSSAGLLEAAALGTRTLNLGNRQRGRERAENVVDCVECSASALHLAFTQVEALAPVPSAQFGDGQTGVRIAELLASADPNRYSLAKHNTF
jgi:UDP-N-acetylglucosamine 2-epimerase